MIIQGDCIEKLKTLPENSVDSIVTDPPYELGFMGKKWDSIGISYNKDMWAECLRVLKHGGHLLAFSGTRTYHRMAVAIEDAGFEVRDMIEWVYGSGFPKSLNIGKAVNSLETNEWSKISKAFDNVDQKSIMEVWKTNAKLAGIKLVKNLTGVGSNTRRKYFVHDIAVLYFNQEKENASAITAELNLCVPSRTSEENLSIAVGSVEQNTELSQNLVKSVVKLSENQRAKSWNIFTAQCDVKEWLNENTEVSHKVDEALKTLRGNKKYSNEEIINVLCVVIPSVLKHTILNQSKTFQSLDTNQKMECASAINVIITEYTAENLISNTVAILKSKAVDKLQGNEREVVGKKETKDFSHHKGSMMGKETTIDNKTQTTTITDTKGTSEWEGWGTALKPSHESIMVAQKPLDSNSNIEYNIGIISKNILLCLSQLFAKTAESNSELNQKEQKQQDIAQWLAENNINTREDLSEAMGMLPLKLMESLNLNIALYWLNILADLWLAMNTPTIKMELNLTTELKILKSMEWENIFQNITQAKNNKTDGLSVNVLNVVNLLNAVLLKLNYTLTHFAQGSATSQVEKLNFAPNHEPICMARKPLAEKTVAENCLKYGTGGINIDESRVGTEERTYGGMSANKPDVGTFRDDNWVPKDIEITVNGRFPANLIHDNSEEVRECFPESGGGKFSKSGNRIGGNCEYSVGINGRKDAPDNYGDSGNASRFFKSIIYQPKTSKSERNKGCEGLESQQRDESRKEGNVGGDNPRNRGVHKVKNNHPTVKPVELMRYLIKMITPKGGTVLDPFMGSGSTGIAAKLEGFDFIGIEKEPEYIKIAEARISGWEKEPEQEQLL